MRRSLALALLVWVVAAGEARAATITWEFEAIVRGSEGMSVSTPFFDAFVFQPGQILRGSLSFDSTVSDTSPSAAIGTYPGLVTSLYLEYMNDRIGEGTPPYFFASASSSSTSQMRVFDFPSGDFLWLESGVEPQLLGQSSIRRFRIGLGEPVGGPSLWSSGDMVLTPPPLSALAPFDLATFHAAQTRVLWLASADASLYIGAELTLLRAVPEPTRFALVAMGFLALIGFRLRSRPR